MKINDRINKWEKKYRRHAIHNLTLYIVIGYVAGYIIQWLVPAIYEYLLLDPYQVLHGQVWRLFTWIIVPPNSFGIFTILMLFFYYSIGTQLERTWGAFRYNLYLLSGILFNILGAFIVYIYTVMQLGGFGVANVSQFAGMAVAASTTTYYVTTSIFFAYALMNPNEQIWLYGIIPIKVKWLGYLYGVFILYDFVKAGALAPRITIIMSLLNFILYFLTTREFYRISPKRVKSKVVYTREVKKSRPAGAPMHKCAVCGRTEKDSDDLVFRYCSKCNGNYEYCQDHLFTHEHKK